VAKLIFPKHIYITMASIFLLKLIDNQNYNIKFLIVDKYFSFTSVELYGLNLIRFLQKICSKPANPSFLVWC